MSREMYLYSWKRDQYNYDIVIQLDPDTGKSIVGVRKCDKLMATNDRIKTIEKAFIYTVKKYIKSCNGMKFKDAKNVIVGKKSFIDMCDTFGNVLMEASTGKKQ